MRLPRATGARPGFTLIELVIALAIGALVVTMLGFSLSLSIRLLEKSRDKEADPAPLFLELVTRQLQFLDTSAVPTADGPRGLFTGDARSLAFLTTHSVRAISGGAPVIVRYAWDPEAKSVLYAELPYDPYHPEPVKRFLAARFTAKGPVAAVAVPLAGFTLAYLDDESGEWRNVWEEDRESVPRAVRVTLGDPRAADAQARIIATNLFGPGGGS